MHTTLTILSVPVLTGVLLTLDAVWPLSAHLAFGLMALTLAGVLTLAVRHEMKKLKQTDV